MSMNDPEFEAFANAGEVEIGESNAAEQPEEKPAGKPAKPAATEPVEDGPEAIDDEADGDEQTGEDDPDGEADDGKLKKSAKDHQIERLKREKAELARQLRQSERQEIENLKIELEALKNGLQGGNSNGNQNIGTSEPDPSDFEKYPLGHLDPLYIEDKLDWVAEKKAAERADAALQRQQEVNQLQPLLEKVDQITQRGTEIYDDFQETVVEAGMRGDWDLQQPTFEAAAEAENGVEILYALANDPKEASRVAKLSPYQQLKYVADRDAEISKGKTPRRTPKAGEPPQNTARGANSRTQINPATDNLDDFEKAWEQDVRKSKR